MRQKLIGTAAGLSATVFLAYAALAAQAPTTEDFAKNVALSDMFEIQSGQLASLKGENGDVKSFGSRMVADHTNTSQQLKGLLTDKEIKVELPGKLDTEHQSNLDRLNGLSGAQFDKEFVRMQNDAHQNAVALFEKYAAAGEDDNLRRWAKETVPTLKEHLEDTKRLKSSVESAQVADTKKPDHNATEADLRKSNAVNDTKNTGKKSNIKYITRQTPNDWTAEALIGRTVENAQGVNLGNINNVIINEKGDVVAVVIGVGGVLGIGEKNVGVPFEFLDFRTADPAEKAIADKPADKVNDERVQEKKDAAAARFDSEHANMHIVLDTTKDDLEKAPAFAWLDEQATDANSVTR